MNWTPGPWHHTQPAIGFADIRAGRKLVFAVAHPTPVCGDPEMPNEEKYANLRLATHAPELYDALTLAVAHLERFHSDEMDSEGLKICRAALAKARGENPDAR